MGDGETDHAQIDLDGGGDPQRVGVPGLVVALHQALVDEPGAHGAGDGDDEAEAEEHEHGDALPHLHLEPQHQRDRRDGGEEVGRAVDDARGQGDGALVHAAALAVGPVCPDRVALEEGQADEGDEDGDGVGDVGVDGPGERVFSGVAHQAVVEAEDGEPGEGGREGVEDLGYEGDLACRREDAERYVPDMTAPAVALIGKYHARRKADCGELVKVRRRNSEK